MLAKAGSPRKEQFLLLWSPLEPLLAEQNGDLADKRETGFAESQSEHEDV